MKSPVCRECKGSTLFDATVTGMLVVILLAGCAGPGGAGLDRSQEVLRAFMNGEVMPGHRYYSTGSESAPDAILGIEDSYTLVTERWKEREVTPQSLRQIVGLMNSRFGAPHAGLLGSWVLSDTGERIGIWYSPVGLTVVEMLGENKVKVNPPHPETIRQLDPYVHGN